MCISPNILLAVWLFLCACVPPGFIFTTCLWCERW